MGLGAQALQRQVPRFGPVHFLLSCAKHPEGQNKKGVVFVTADLRYFVFKDYQLKDSKYSNQYIDEIR